MASLTLHIEGMSCGHCVNAVNRGLASVPGLQIVKVTMGRADLEYDPGQVAVDQIVAAVEKQGYRATPAG